MLLLIAVFLLAYLAQRYVLEHGLDGVTISMESSSNLVDPEEEFEVIAVIENRKKTMPVLLQVKEALPVALTIVGEDYVAGNVYSNVRYHTYSQYLRRCGRVRRSFRATLPNRGRYFFHGASLQANDFLGLKESQMQVDLEREMVVAPKGVGSLVLEEALGGFLGEVSVRRYIMEDPILTIGFREYTGREPLRAIAWNQSAKGRGLLVKQYDYTTEPAITVILGVEGGTAQQIEDCYSITRTVCEWLEGKRIRYDFLTNASSAGALGIWKSVSEGLGEQHLNKILEGLGRATYDFTEPLETTLSRAYKRVGNPSYIVILPQESDTSRGYVRRFSEIKGGAVRVITPEEVLS